MIVPLMTAKRLMRVLGAYRGPERRPADRPVSVQRDHPERVGSHPQHPPRQPDSSRLRHLLWLRHPGNHMHAADCVHSQGIRTRIIMNNKIVHVIYTCMLYFRNINFYKIVQIIYSFIVCLINMALNKIVNAIHAFMFYFRNILSNKIVNAIHASCFTLGISYLTRS